MYIFPEEILRAKGFEEENFQALLSNGAGTNLEREASFGNRE